MYLFDMGRIDDGLRVGTSAASGESRFSLSWQEVQPRNQPPRPRSHHTAAYDKAGRTALVFGGYSSAGGGLTSELWAFSFDHMEWWQPETTGETERSLTSFMISCGRLSVEPPPQAGRCLSVYPPATLTCPYPHTQAITLPQGGVMCRWWSGGGC